MGAYEKADYSLGSEQPTLCSEKDIKNFMDHCYQYAYPANGAFWQQAYIDKRFRVGDQSLYSMLYGNEDYMRGKRLFFNLIMRHCNMIDGYQRRNRKSTTVLPNQDNDPLAEQYSAVMKWSESRDNFQELFSQSFSGAVDVGISYLHMYPDYTRDPYSGELLTDVVPYNSVLIDPYFTKQDLSDAQFIWRRRWVTRQTLDNLLPDDSYNLDKIAPTGAKDGRFPLQAELMNLAHSNLYTYDEFYYRSMRKATMIEDPMTGQSIEWEHENNTDIENARIEQWLAEQPWMTVRETQVPTVKLVIQVSNKTVYHGPNLLGVDRYPFVPNLCYHQISMQKMSQRLMGVIRNARDAQYLYNRRKIIELDILESQINSGWIYPTDAVVDPKAFRQKGQGYLIPLKAGRSASEVQRIEAPGIQESMISLSRALGEDITNIMGVNEELLGSADDDKAGILSMLRQGAGLTTLQNIFDQADFAQREYGRLRLEAIRRNWTKGKVQSILGNDKEIDPMFFTSQSLKYSIEVEQGNLTATQRQQELQQKLYMREAGINIPEESIIKSAYFADKQEIMQNMQQQQEAEQQQQQAQQEAEQQKQNADMMLKFAEAKEKIAGAEERQTSSVENLANAQYKGSQSELNQVKQMAELDEMQLQNLKQTIEMAQLIQKSQNTGGE